MLENFLVITCMKIKKLSDASWFKKQVSIIFRMCYLMMFIIKYENCQGNLKKLFVSYHPLRKKKLPGRQVKLFFHLIQTKYYFWFQMLPYHSCSVNFNWNNTQFCSSVKPLRNVLSSVFWFANFCFLSFLHRTSVQKWKKNWFCYVHK